MLRRAENERASPGAAAESEGPAPVRAPCGAERSLWKTAMFAAVEAASSVRFSGTARTVVSYSSLPGLKGCASFLLFLVAFSILLFREGNKQFPNTVGIFLHGNTNSKSARNCPQNPRKSTGFEFVLFFGNLIGGGWSGFPKRHADPPAARREAGSRPRFQGVGAGPARPGNPSCFCGARRPCLATAGFFSPDGRPAPVAGRAGGSEIGYRRSAATFCEVTSAGWPPQATRR